MSSNLEDACLQLEHAQAIRKTLERQLNVACENEHASKVCVRKAKFVQDLDDACFICQTKFSDTAGLPSFSVVSLSRCRCTGNARMVHLKCWSTFPAGEEKCGSCNTPVHLVDEEGNVLKVTVEIRTDHVQATAGLPQAATAGINEFTRQNPGSTTPAPPASTAADRDMALALNAEQQDEVTNPFRGMFGFGSNLPAPPRLGGMFTRRVQQGRILAHQSSEAAAAAAAEQRAYVRQTQNQGRASGAYVPPPFTFESLD